MTLLADLRTFAMEHEYCGELDGGVEGNWVWFTCTRGAVIVRRRCIASALTMFAANTYLINPILRATATKEIEFRVSIDYGYVTIARLGPARRFNANVAIGTTANFTSKMLRHAGPGEIVMGEAAKNQLPTEWQTLWTQRMAVETGWEYRLSRQPYPLYRYTGR